MGKCKNFLPFSVKSLAVKKWMQPCMEEKTAYSLQLFMSRQWILMVEEKVYRQLSGGFDSRRIRKKLPVAGSVGKTLEI